MTVGVNNSGKHHLSQAYILLCQWKSKEIEIDTGHSTVSLRRSWLSEVLCIWLIFSAPSIVSIHGVSPKTLPLWRSAGLRKNPLEVISMEIEVLRVVNMNLMSRVLTGIARSYGDYEFQVTAKIKDLSKWAIQVQTVLHVFGHDLASLCVLVGKINAYKYKSVLNNQLDLIAVKHLYWLEWSVPGRQCSHPHETSDYWWAWRQWHFIPPSTNHKCDQISPRKSVSSLQ